VEEKIKAMGEKNAPPEETAALVNGLLGAFSFPQNLRAIHGRLKWGLFPVLRTPLLPHARRIGRMIMSAERANWYKHVIEVTAGGS
jgi:hypothetical protein